MGIDALGRIADGGDGGRLGRDQVEEHAELPLGAGGKLVERRQPGQPRSDVSGHRQT